jgi:hypothetical protein
MTDAQAGMVILHEHPKGTVVFAVDTALSLEREPGASALNRIYFDRQNEGYTWMLWRPFTMEEYDVLPLRLRGPNWYHIWGLLGQQGDFGYEVFVSVSDKGRLTTYPQYIPGP